MRINKSVISPTQIKLSITADDAFMAKVKEHTLRHIAGEMKLPGFRPGKAPLSLVEKNADPSHLQSDFLDEAINRLYSEAVRAEQLRPVANPEVAVKKFVPYTTLEFEATVEVISDITLPDYKKIKKALPKVTITAEDIAGVIKTLQTRLAEKVPTERAAKDGDEVVMDFSGTDAKGETIAGASAEQYPLIIGSNSLIPGFEPKLVGMKAGETKSFDVVFPKDYHAKNLAGTKVTFKVTVHVVNELKEPKVDDELAAKAGPFKTLKELKDDIKVQLTADRQNDAMRAYENELITDIAKKSKVAIPAVLIDDQVRRNEEEERNNLTYRGQTWQEHLKEDGVTEEEHRERNRPAAEETIRTSLVLSEIAEREKVTFTSEEVDIRIQLMKGQYTDPSMQAEIDKPENRRDIEARIMTEKTITMLVGYASK
jgi:trigger factor